MLWPYGSLSNKVGMLLRQLVQNILFFLLRIILYKKFVLNVLVKKSSLNYFSNNSLTSWPKKTTISHHKSVLIVYRLFCFLTNQIDFEMLILHPPPTNRFKTREDNWRELKNTRSKWALSCFYGPREKRDRLIGYGRERESFGRFIGLSSRRFYAVHWLLL